jgi:hypothetical protein
MSQICRRGNGRLHSRAACLLHLNNETNARNALSLLLLTLFLTTKACVMDKPLTPRQKQAYLDWADNINSDTEQNSSTFVQDTHPYFLLQGIKYECFSEMEEPHSPEPINYRITDIDNRLTYRQGWPLLPVLPVRTSRENVPKALSDTSVHLSNIRKVLKGYVPCIDTFRNTYGTMWALLILFCSQLTVHNVKVAHRYNAGKSIDKSTQTLCVLAKPMSPPDGMYTSRLYYQSFTQTSTNINLLR